MHMKIPACLICECWTVIYFVNPNILLKANPMRKMNRIIQSLTVVLSFLLAGIPVFSQTTGYSGTGANIDVTYHRCDWRINPDSASKGIKGTITTYFVAKIASISTINFDLNKTSFNNGSLSVYYHGNPVSFSFPSSGNVNIINITLPSALPQNTLDSITINYNGVPPAVSGQAEGYQKKASGGYNYIYSLSETYEDRDWWPCKADMQDKVDSMDIYLNVPNAFTAVTLGRLVDSSTAGANQIFHWKTNLPVASYLVAVGVARYRVYDRGTVNINGTNVPVWYFIFPGKTSATYTNILNALDRSMLELTAFSNYFGDYPFKTEKHGYYEFGWGGGMEHQSLSAMGGGSLTSWGVIAHELAHQWWGDKVTFGTWNHLWLAEGFARYSEALAAELVPALGQNPSTVRSGFKSTANNSTYRNYGCYIPNAYISSSDAMWSSVYGTTVYERGAMVVSMLRTLLGSTKFSQACQNYLNDPAFAYRSATTEDLRAHMEAVAGGTDLTEFFNSYVYGNGYPLYNTGIGWANPGTNRIIFQVTTQSKSTGSTVSYYNTPIAIRVQGSLAGQDTVLVIYDRNGQLSRAGDGIGAPVSGNVISFDLGFNPVTVTFDPFSQTLATGTTFLNSVLDVHVIDFVMQQQPFGNKLSLTVSADEGELENVILQRSRDGLTYSDAGQMTAGSSAGLIRQLHFTDQVPYMPVTFYRAKINAVNESTYSFVLRAEQADDGFVKLYPNPAGHEVFIRWQSLAEGIATVKIFDTEGKNVRQRTSDINYLSLSVSDLPAGVYTVQVIQSDKIVMNRQFIIKR